MLILAVAGMMSCGSPKPAETAYVELLHFTVNEEVSDSAFAAVNAEVNQFLTKQPGFISRSLGKSNDTLWVDVLRWNSKEHFERAFKLSGENAAVQSMGGMINSSSMQSLSFDELLTAK